MSTNANPALGYVQFHTPVSPGSKQRIRDYLHTWVLTAFVGPRPPGGVARHLNDVRTDNRLENLVWGSRSDNMNDAYRNERFPKKTHCPYGHPLVAPNLTADSVRHGTRRCLACNRARAKARGRNEACTQELRDAAYQEVSE